MLTEAEKDLLADLDRAQMTGHIEHHLARSLVTRGLIAGPMEKRHLTQAGSALLAELRERKETA